MKEKQSDKFILGVTGHRGKDLGIHYNNEASRYTKQIKTASDATVVDGNNIGCSSVASPHLLGNVLNR